MTIKYITPNTLAKPGGHYSHGVKVGGLLFISGQLPIDAQGNKLNEASFEAQVNQTLTNIELTLAASGCSKDRLVQVRVYVTDIANWPAFNAIYAAWIGDAMPARAVVPVPELHYGFSIEIEAVASLI